MRIWYPDDLVTSKFRWCYNPLRVNSFQETRSKEKLRIKRMRKVYEVDINFMPDCASTG